VCKDEFHALAERVLFDRLVGFGHSAASPVGKDGPKVSRFLAPTADELTFDAMLGARPEPAGTVTVHPAVAKLVAEFKAAAA